MSMKVKAVALTVAVVVIVACGGSGEDSFGNKVPVITACYPCKGLAGDQITIIGHDLTGVGSSLTADVGGTNATIVSATPTKIVITAPAGAGAAPVHIPNSIGQSTSADTFTYGATTVVPEVEPNDNINGTNATQVGMNTKASGTLNGVADKDHFVFGCLDKGQPFTIKVTPPVVNQVFVDGVGYPVDANGVALFYPQGSSALVGLTGGSGAYTIEMSLK